MYSNSVIAIAGVFWPRMFVAINESNWTRFAATAGVGTVPTNADSNAVAAARAWAAAASACPAAALNHPTYGVAAAAIDSDAGPAHGPLVNPEITDWNDVAAPDRSDANPSQADAAANNGPDPAPANINSELISGGNHGNEGNVTSQHLQPHQRLRRLQRTYETVGHVHTATVGSYDNRTPKIDAFAK